MSGNRLVVENLSVSLGRADARRDVVRGLSLTLEPGKAVALVGESGSGKSVTARSLVGLAGPSAIVNAKALTYGGHDLRSWSQAEWQRLRGKEIGFVLQDALVSLDPLRTIGQEVVEALTAHGMKRRQDAHRQMLELLARVGIPDPALRAQQRSDQLSGGLRQRALIATALALDPPIVIADEPTTALDTTVQAQILDLLATIKARGTGLLIISHDLSVVSRLADEVLVLHHGEVVERGTPADVLGEPRHSYTRSLLASVPGTRRARAARRDTGTTGGKTVPLQPAPILEAVGLSKLFEGPDRKRRAAVTDVGFALAQGQTLGIIGESGSGKTTAARLTLALLQPDTGHVTFDNQPWVGASGRPSERERRARRPQFGMIYQDPLGSFDPRWTVGQVLDDALRAGGFPAAERRVEIGRLLDQVRLSIDHASRHPLELSGGQRQRVAIARAIAPRPKVIVCDEPVSALDISVQAQVLDLLLDLQSDLGISYLFISHDLGVIRHISDAVVVMQHGRIVERGSVDAVFDNPQHPFTKQLLSASASTELGRYTRSAA